MIPDQSKARVLIGRKLYNRIPYGEDDYDNFEKCPCCRVQKGEFHTVDCDMERCPLCSSQFCGCSCDKKKFWKASRK